MIYFMYFTMYFKKTCKFNSFFWDYTLFYVKIKPVGIFKDKSVRILRDLLSLCIAILNKAEDL